MALKYNANVIVNFMCHFGWDTVPGYVAKHSGYFCEYVLNTYYIYKLYKTSILYNMYSTVYDSAELCF